MLATGYEMTMPLVALYISQPSVFFFQEMTLHETNVAMSKRIMELDQLQHDHSILQSEAESLRGEVASLTDRLDRANR